ncbi:MAG TPA: radical SAM protein, partial [Acidimicrobiales bacterium]|nr:radical SAM protein [Acidimicrobiales bacterium]
AAALPEVDLVAGFGVPISAGPVATLPEAVPVRVDLAGPRRWPVAGTSFDLLELPRPATGAPWAYVKVAEGCDRRCGFCAIPSFRGRQRSRAVDDVLAEVRALAEGDGDGPGAREIVLVAQDLASYGRDRGAGGPGRAGAGQPIVGLTRAVSELVPRTRLLYLYPSGLTGELIDAVLATGVPYFDLSLQHVARPLLARMRRWGDGDRFLARIEAIRRDEPSATFRSSFILGYPGETEMDHDALLAFLREAQLDWAGFFPFSPEAGTHAVGLGDQVRPDLAMERLRECAELQDAITARRRDALVGERRQVLVDGRGVARTVHEAPEIDGIVRVPRTLRPGALVDVIITGSAGVDLEALQADPDGGTGPAPVGAVGVALR